MKRKVMYAIMLSMVAVSVLGLSACDWLAAGLFSVSGTAVNVSQPVTSTEYWKGSTNTTLTLAGATITLTNVYDSTKNAVATVDSSGNWSALDVSAGKYRITGSATGWTFIPKEMEITGIFQTAEPILAFETPADKSEILIVAEWQRPMSGSAIDVDSVLVLDQNTTGVGQSAVFSSMYDYGAAASYDVPSRYVGTAVTQDRDVYGAANLIYTAKTPLVETIRVKTNPFGSGSGQLRYFLNAFDSATLTGDSFATTPIPSTYATVTVMQPSATATDGLLGIFTVALDSYEKTLGIIKIDVTGGASTSYVFKSYGNIGSSTMKSISSGTGVPVEFIR